MSVIEPKVKFPSNAYPKISIDESESPKICFSIEQEKWMNERIYLVKQLLQSMGIFYKENTNNTWATRCILKFNYFGKMYCLEWHMHLMTQNLFFVRLNKNNKYYYFKSCFDFNNNFRDILES